MMAAQIADGVMAGDTVKVQDIDWAGRWFDLVEETQGEFVGMRGGRLLADGTIAWTFVPHARFDGLGGFVDLLRRSLDRADLPVPERRAPRPSWWQRSRALLSICAATPRIAGRWIRQEVGRGTGTSSRAVGRTNAATHLFTREETRALERQAKLAHASLNALLLAKLAAVSADEITDGPAIWMMPVNMRGPVALARDTANHTGYLQVDLDAQATPALVQSAIKHRLRLREHWGSWLFLNVGRLVGYGGMRAIYRHQMRRFGGRPFVGSFSNLGSWRGVGTWFVCPPVTLNAPVAAGAISCDDCLSLTLEAHASIRDGDAWAREHLARWIAALARA